MRNVREKLLSNQLQSFQPRDVEEDSDSAVRGLTICRLQGHDPQVENSSFTAVGFDLHAGALLAANTIKKRIIDRRVAREFS